MYGTGGDGGGFGGAFSDLVLVPFGRCHARGFAGRS